MSSTAMPGFWNMAHYKLFLGPVLALGLATIGKPFALVTVHWVCPGGCDGHRALDGFLLRYIRTPSAHKRRHTRMSMRAHKHLQSGIP